MDPQHSFLCDCWTYASPEYAGPLRANKPATVIRTEGSGLPSPERAQGDRARLSECDTTDYPLRDQDSGKYLSEEIEPRSEYWAKHAAVLLSNVHDDQRRADLRYMFEERESIACLDGGLSADGAGRVAFAYLHAAMRPVVRHGV